jgi:sortase (surface protein transpeptidase)
VLRKIIKKARYTSSVVILYGTTLLLLWQGIGPVIPNVTGKARANQQNLSQTLIPPADTPKPKEIIVQSGIPVRLLVPELGMDKKILPGVYDNLNDTWIVSDAGIHYAGPSVPANDNSGSTLIYGHNNKFTFGPLQYLQPGDIAEIFTDNNLKFTYSYVARADFSPTDTSIFEYAGPPTLSLQTCTGWLNQIRSLYTFNFQKVEKI